MRERNGFFPRCRLEAVGRIMMAGLALLSGLAVSTVNVGAADPADPGFLLDGEIHPAEWDGAATTTDPTGDPPWKSGRDLVALFARLDAQSLWLGLRFGERADANDEPGLTLLIDADADSTTGSAGGFAGFEIAWDLGGREGRIAGLEQSSDRARRLHDRLGLISMPTVDGPSVEIALPRQTRDGLPLMASDRIGVACFDRVSGDRIPDTGTLQLTVTESVPVEALPLERERPEDLRILSWNVRGDGLFDAEDPDRMEAIARILRAVDPDVFVFEEVWKHDAFAVRDRLAQWMDRDFSQWSAVKEDRGNVLLSRYRIVQTWDVGAVEGIDPDRLPTRMTAALLLVPRGQLLLVANHWHCCGADDKRQVEADALAAFVHDAVTRGDDVELPYQSPVVLVGDFNLVGRREPLETLIEGKIHDKRRFGSPGATDWDGSGLLPVPLRHLTTPFTHTWRNPRGRFYPGRLDWVFVTDSVIRLGRHYVLDTDTVDPRLLRRYGLRQNDTLQASDHAPVVVDLQF